MITDKYHLNLEPVRYKSIEFVIAGSLGVELYFVSHSLITSLAFEINKVAL